VREQRLEGGDYVMAHVAAVIDDDVEGSELAGDRVQEALVPLVSLHDAKAALFHADL
jgi:hypothetical protein